MKKITILLTAIFCLFSLSATAQKAKRVTQVTDEIKAQISAATPKSLSAKATKGKKILIYSNCSSNYVHTLGIQSFEHYIKTLKENIGDAYDFVVSNELSNFEKDNLAKFDAVVLSNTTGRIFDKPLAEMKKLGAEEKAKVTAKHDELLANLMAYVENGGGLFGIHGACDANKDNDTFADLIGGRFINHPWTCGGQQAVIAIEDTESPLVKGIWEGSEFISEDELYQVTTGYDRTKQRVLCAIDFDKSPIKGDLKNKSKQIHRDDHDFGLVWVKSYGKGRVCYVALGHDHRAFIIPEILELYTRGMQFAADDLKLDTTPIAKPAKK
ncbi:MAG: ThuA domain-containing protein [Opitutales bacterium]